MAYSTLGPVYDAIRVAELLGITYSPTELAGFGLPPPALDGYVTFFDPGWNCMRLKVVPDKSRGRIFSRELWRNTQNFASLEEPPRYRQLRMEAVQDSKEKTFAEEHTVLGKEEEIPRARVVIMGMVLHFLATGERLFPTSYVRCLEMDSGNVRVYVGCSESSGIFVAEHWHFEGCAENIGGIAPVRKS